FSLLRALHPVVANVAAWVATWLEISQGPSEPPDPPVPPAAPPDPPVPPVAPPDPAVLPAAPPDPAVLPAAPPDPAVPPAAPPLPAVLPAAPPFPAVLPAAPPAAPPCPAVPLAPLLPPHAARKSAGTAMRNSRWPMCRPDDEGFESILAAILSQAGIPSERAVRGAGLAGRRAEIGHRLRSVRIRLVAGLLAGNVTACREARKKAQAV